MNRNLPGERSAGFIPAPRPPRAMRPAPRRGVALVITLIMLALITVITITILAIASRDRAAVSQAANLTDSRLAAEAGFERAKGELLAQITFSKSMMGYDLTVSRSISNALDLLRVDPRVPVFPANLRPDEHVEGRFFFDLNRNDRFEATYLGYPGDPQWIGLLNKPDQPHGPNNRFHGRFSFFVLPAGKTLDVNFIHNMASAVQVPGIGGNYFRNQGFGPWEINLGGFLADLTPGTWTYAYDGFPSPLPSRTAFEDAKSLLMYRYAGSFYNLSNIFSLYGAPAVTAFTTDMIDDYAHAPGAMGVTYPAVEPETLALASTFPWPGAESPRSFFTPSEFFDPAKTSVAFTNRLAQAGASTSTNDFERYTFYRMLAQLGTDSVAAEDNRIHLNYVNQPIRTVTYDKLRTLLPLPPRNLADTNDYVPFSATNFVSWDLLPELSVCFFTNVAQRLFQEQFFQFNPSAVVTTVTDTNNNRITVTNNVDIPNVVSIPITPTNLYSPALHRLFQAAANIYDATRKDIYPSVFLPQFTVINPSNIFLTGFINDNKRNSPNFADYLQDSSQYGIPLVIGAKKDFPNFNEYTLRTDLQVTRKLEFVRPGTNSPPNQTNQMYILGISNLFAAEAWNSYFADYPRTTKLEVTNIATVRITNQFRSLFFRQTNSGNAWLLDRTSPLTTWKGNKFKLPLYDQQVLVAPSRFLFRAPTNEYPWEIISGTNYYYTETEDQIGFPVPDWQFSISNQFLYILTDTDSSNIVDFVLSTAFNSAINIDAVLMDSHPLPGSLENSTVASMWDTNRADGSQNITNPTVGIVKQIDVALGNTEVDLTTWKSYVNEASQGLDKDKAIMSCRKFFRLGVWGPYASNLVGTTSLNMQSPFCPTRKLVQTTTWQADDPLVHYHVGDLLIFPTNSIIEPVVPPTSPVPTNMTLATIGHMNNRYAPWGGNPEKNDPFNPSDANAYNPSIKDPGVRYSDDWDFPSSKFPGIGWLGRVHRGTPWQTVYFKPDVAPQDTWRLQSADYLWYPPVGNQTFKFVRAHPSNDWAMAEMFTTATDPNSTRGLLSINQTNVAAWSALLSGAVVLANTDDDKTVLSRNSNAPIQLTPLVIQPVAVDTNVPPALLTLVDGINRFRRTLPNEAFTTLGQLFQVTELTTFSPWLNTAANPQSGKFVQRMFGLNDTAYERIPQQILSLLKTGDSRFVVYAIGQALKPADASILTQDTTINGRLIPARTCTNYQVTAEVAVRAVIRVEGTPQNPRTIVESFNILPPE